jgi:hypothetical protein
MCNRCTQRDSQAYRDEVFLLHNGPRAGQLVDELPRGYVRFAAGESEDTAFGEFSASPAIWEPTGPFGKRPSASPRQDPAR